MSLALKRVGVSYYIHAWQALLMFLAGTLSVLAACAGYLQSGGGEELLRRALANLKTGAAQFDSIDFRQWRDGKMIVRNLRHNDFDWPRQNPIAHFSGLYAEEVDVQMDLFPWPPNVKAITVRGMPHTALKLEEGFLQSGLIQDLKDRDMPIIRFEDCDLKLGIGDMTPLLLSGCGGELRRDMRSPEAPEKKRRLHGEFSLSKLNGKPFNIVLESLEDGRWILTGQKIEFNSNDTLKTRGGLLAGKIDPVASLVRALFSGEMGVKGALTSLRIGIQPAEDNGSFSCAGEVGYKNLELQLPANEAANVIPRFFLDKLWGVDEAQDENFLPRWMLLDHIRTGGDGRVAFHMAKGVLNFACDEGAGSAFTGIWRDHEYPALEAFKGSLETDEEGHARRMVLRGFLGGRQARETGGNSLGGEQLAFETRIERQPNHSRRYELALEPRAGGPFQAASGQPLWRFVSEVTDYFAVQRSPDEKDGAPLAKFKLEVDARDFPLAGWLPPDFRIFGGRLRVEGQLVQQQAGKYRLFFNTLSLGDGATLAYIPAVAQTENPAVLGKAIKALFGGRQPWQLQNLALQGEAEVELLPELKVNLKNCSLTSGLIVYAGLVTDIGVQRPQLHATYTLSEDNSSALSFTAALLSLPQLKFDGRWPEQGQTGAGSFTLQEKDIPLVLHPQRGTLDKIYLTPSDYGAKQYVNRTTSVEIKADGSPKIVVKP